MKSVGRKNIQQFVQIQKVALDRFIVKEHVVNMFL
jgi:hypothetical protein